MKTSALAPRPERLARRVAAAFLAVTVLVAVPLAAIAAIDPWPKYQPQTKCSPRAKPGTLQLAAWLQKRYPGSGSYGISRHCDSGGRSEHKEGRAFDWRVNVHDAKERAYAYDFIRRALATDKRGNEAALARRMGIMYMIWDDHIYSATSRYAKRGYLHSACETKKRCSDTLRHRDHIHISLTWAAARGNTSWYQGRTTTSPNAAPSPEPAPAPKPRPRPAPNPSPKPGEPVEFDGRDGGTLQLPVTADGATIVSNRVLLKGRTYKLTVHGLYRYADRHTAVGDAHCTWAPRQGTWVPRPNAPTRRAHGSLQLKVNGAAVLASSACSPHRHVYATRFTPKRTGPLRLRVDNKYGDAAGRALTVIVSAPRTRVTGLLPTRATTASAPAGGKRRVNARWALEDAFDLRGVAGERYSDSTLQAGVTYRITVSGVVRLQDGVYTDGQCLAMDGRWEQSGSLDLAAPGADHGNLYVNGIPFRGKAPAEDPTGCHAHLHQMTYTPAVTSRAHFALWDPFDRRDNEGALRIQVARLSPVPTPAPAAAETPGAGTEWTRWYEFTTIDTRARGGLVSDLRFRKGERVRLRVLGRYTATRGGVAADAACVTQSGAWTAKPLVPTGQDLYELYVDGAAVTWLPSAGGGDCSPQNEYHASFVATKDGPVRLSVFDLDHRDNDGKLSVLLVRG